MKANRSKSSHLPHQRPHNERLAVRTTSILTVSDVLEKVEYLRWQEREHLVAFFINARQELLKVETIAMGGLNVTSLQPRDILAPALKLPALAIILVHNHPSGDASPSQEDLYVTERITQGCELVGLQLLDHIIVAGDQHYSFREAGMM